MKSFIVSEMFVLEMLKEKGVDDFLGIDWLFLFEDIGWLILDLGYIEFRIFKVI